MSKKFLVSIDLNQNELQKAVIQNLATDPVGGKEGQLYWNTVTKKLMKFNGAEWTEVGDSYELPVASADTLGGVKVGDHLSIDGAGVLSTTGLATTEELGNKADDTAVVHLAGAENITGVKNFTSGLKNSSTISASDSSTQVATTAWVTTKVASDFKDVSYNSDTGVLTFTKQNGSTKEIDLPLELLVKSGRYDAATKSIILELANGDTISIPASELVDEYYADNTTLELKNVDGKQTFNVKDGVFQRKLTFDATPTEGSNNPVTSDGIYKALKAGVHKFVGTNPSLSATGGICTWTVAHNLGTADYVVSVKEVATNEEVYATVVYTDNNTLTIKVNSESTISAGTYKVVIVG